MPFLQFASLQLQGVISGQVARYALVLTWLSAMCGFACVVSLWPNATRTHKITAIVLVALVIGGIFYAINVLASRYLISRLKTTLTCQIDGLPAHFPGTSPNAMLIDPYFPSGVTTGWLINSARGLPPDYQPTARLIYQCELDNQSGAIVPDVHLHAQLRTVRARRGADSVYCDGLKIIQERNIDLNFGDLAVGGRVWFYFYNGVSNCAAVNFSGPQSSGHVLAMINNTKDPYVSLNPALLH